MAGRITISTLNDDTGVLATQNGMSGIAKAWVNFNGEGTVSIRASFNVSSITDNGTGDYTVNFITALPDANYAAVISTAPVYGSNVPTALLATSGTATEQAPTASAFRFGLIQSGVGGLDTKYVTASFFR
jgi:hypothetical protein